VPSINPYSGTEQLSFTNPASITSLSITIDVVRSSGVTSSGQWNSFPGDLTESVTTSNGVLVYTYVLNSGQTVPANNNSAVDAQWAGNGTVHSTTTDTYTVTSTSGGVTSTVTGHFSTSHLRVRLQRRLESSESVAEVPTNSARSSSPALRGVCRASE
jgi:hypothetical protein